MGEELQRYIETLRTAFDKADFRTVMQLSYTVAERYFETRRDANDKEVPEDRSDFL